VESEAHLTVNEWLEMVTYLFEGQTSQLAVEMPVLKRVNVIEAGINEIDEIFESDVRVTKRRPSNRERVHPVFGFQLVGDERRVFPATSRHNYIPLSVGSAMLVQQPM